MEKSRFIGIGLLCFSIKVGKRLDWNPKNLAAGTGKYFMSVEVGRGCRV